VTALFPNAVGLLCAQLPSLDILPEFSESGRSVIPAYNWKQSSAEEYHSRERNQGSPAWQVQT